MRKLILIMLLLLTLASVACAPAKFTRKGQGFDGKDGSDGRDGVDAVIHMTMAIPTYHACYEITDGLWVENEGDHIDVYNNADCDHGPAPKKAYCNNVHEQEVCWVGDMMFGLEGTYSDMILHMVDYGE